MAAPFHRLLWSSGWRRIRGRGRWHGLVCEDLRNYQVLMIPTTLEMHIRVQVLEGEPVERSWRALIAYKMLLLRTRIRDGARYYATPDHARESFPYADKLALPLVSTILMR